MESFKVVPQSHGTKSTDCPFNLTSVGTATNVTLFKSKMLREVITELHFS